MEDKGRLSAFAVIAAAIIGGVFLLVNTLITPEGNPASIGNGVYGQSSPVAEATLYVPPTEDVPSTDGVAPATQCEITTGNPLVALKSEPDTFSQDLVQVPPGAYKVLAHQIVQFGPTEQSWFQIQVGSRYGWVQNDTWTINSKTDSCP